MQMNCATFLPLVQGPNEQIVEKHMKIKGLKKSVSNTKIEVA